MHLVAALFALLLTLVEANFYGFECDRICNLLLKDYRERILQPYPNPPERNLTPTKLKNRLVHFCNAYVTFASSVAESDEEKCPNRCESLVTKLLSDKNLCYELKNDVSPEPESVSRFCSNFNY
ncbi:hypothetical protein OESDEN_24665 [Oesophagostomum dentatum]|uniref:Saposin B-type domain-containing protein n=1 Tax=Oesophagostomum dentatum TaxID=61180 RepID=A0A0B1RSS8_OESDE|nr:hypothetical protein OESDEN_24665 [Oesophagostomum dentatum]